MSDTRDKLSEAKYFLEQMRKCQTERASFRYNLSAFLSAAKSVFDIMRTEYSRMPGFKHWRQLQYDSLKNDRVMGKLIDKRDMNVHQEPVKPDAFIKEKLSATVTAISSVSIVVTRNDGSVEKGTSSSDPVATQSNQPENTQEWSWHFEEIKDKDVLTVCDEYLSKLEAMMTECESRFTK